VATYREQVEDLRDLLLGRLKEASTRDTAPIAKAYLDCLDRIEALQSVNPKPEEGRKSDELAKRRAARVADSARQ
jgi:hypothetical protein